MSEAQARAFFELVSTAELLPHALDAQLTADAGIISFEYGILGMLKAADNQTLRAGELAAALGAPAPKLSKAVTRLEKRGLVERAACAEDGRAINVRLTRDGRRTWLRATPPHIELARDTLLAGLNDEQLTTLADLLESITERLDPERRTGRLPSRDTQDQGRDHPSSPSSRAGT